MKALRVFLIVVVSIVLVFLLSGLTILTSFKQKIQSEFIGEVFKQTIIKEFDELDDEKKEILDEIMEYKGTNDMIDSLIDDYISYASGESDEISEETIDYFFDFIKENKEEIERVSGEKIDIEEITSDKSREELRETLNNGLKEIRVDTNSSAATALKIYGKITSDKFIITLLVICLVLILIIGLLGWSLYKWMLPVGIVLIFSGIFTSLFFVASKLILAAAINQSELNFSLNLNIMLYYGLGELVCGIVFIVVRNILDKKALTKVEA